MRRSVIFALLLCLTLITSGAWAMEMPRLVDRQPVESSLVDQFWVFLSELGCRIDPWGLCRADPREGASSSGGENGVGLEIDPWGAEDNTSGQSGGETGGDLGMQIDPWG